MPESSVSTSSVVVSRRPSVLARSVGLMKPVTWFAPAWAFLCGAIASGAPLWSWQTLGLMALGVFLAGPIVCGLSQVINDYCDKDVDAINEPQRLIPSGLVSNKQVFITIGILSALALGLAWFLGEKVALLTAIGMVLAVIYSAHPVRAKRNGWIGNALVAISYEGLPWLAGHAAFADITLVSLMVAIWYSVGAHGIMTINDFKSIEGDKMAGINTIPVMYGAWGGAWIAVLTMNTAQLFVIMILAASGRWVAAAIIAGLFLLQLPFQARLIRDPKGQAVFYNATGILLFVLGMLVAAIGLR
ncbi:MAG: chlorophyll synthase ChlG [Chloroflexota bacterium]